MRERLDFNYEIYSRDLPRFPPSIRFNLVAKCVIELPTVQILSLDNYCVLPIVIIVDVQAVPVDLPLVIVTSHLCTLWSVTQFHRPLLAVYHTIYIDAEGYFCVRTHRYLIEIDLVYFIFRYTSNDRFFDIGFYRPPSD